MSEEKKPLTGEELERAAGGGVFPARKPKLIYRCTLCSWTGLFESPDKVLQSHAAESPECGGKIVRR